MSFQDRTIVCSDCNTPFTFSAEEQEMYYQRGYANAPKRCPACRRARKANQSANSGYPCADSRFNAAPRPMFPAVCSDCGKQTAVPFEPKLDRPVYCLNCYRKIRAGR